MSRMRDMIIEVQDAIEEGELTYEQIASKYGIPVKDVVALAHNIRDFNVQENDYFDDY